MVKNIPNTYRYKITNINVEHKTKLGNVFISDVKNLMMEIGQLDDKSNIHVVLLTPKLLKAISEYKEK